MPPRFRVKAPIQLLVEGADAKYFFMHLLDYMGINNVEVQGDVEWRGQSIVYRDAPDFIDGLGLRRSLDEGDLAAFNRVCTAILERLDPSDIEIRDFGGNEELPDFLTNFLKVVREAPGGRTSIEAIGIVRDAESSPSDTETAAEIAFKSVHASISASGLSPPDFPSQVVGQKPRIGVLILPPEESQGTLEDVCLQAVQDDPAMFCVGEYIECIEKNLPEWPSRYRKKAKVQAFLASRPEPGMKLGEGAKLGYWNWSHGVFRPIRQFIRDLASP